MTAPYCESTPKPDPAPRRRWRIVGRDGSAGFTAFFAAAPGGLWCVGFVHDGWTPTIARGALVLSVIAAAWCVAFVRCEVTP